MEYPNVSMNVENVKFSSVCTLDNKIVMLRALLASVVRKMNSVILDSDFPNSLNMFSNW